jgi:hypothetical protein
MVLKSCRRFLVFFLSLISYKGFSQTNTKVNSNTDCCPTAVDNNLRLTSADPAQTGKHLFSLKTIGIGLAYLPAMLSKISNVQLENYLPLQFKYAILMNQTVEKLTNTTLYKTIDEWFGTRYRYGGTTHRGIDCSAFMQKVGEYAFGWILPRTAREQYALMQPVCREDIHEGDFVFFNTHGGISHVGMYLQNNKFVHSCTSSGVMISDLDDRYWAPRIVGFKRMDDSPLSSAN